MSASSKGVWLGVACLALLGTGLPLERAQGQQAVPLVVIVSPKTTTNELSLRVLRRIFRNEPAEWTSGKRYIPMNQTPGTPTRVAFDRAVLGLAPNQIVRFWVDQRIRGKSGAPRTVDSTALLARVVANVPGAISYVRAARIPPQLKALKIDGKAPGDKGYPLATPEAGGALRGFDRLLAATR